VSAGEHRSTIGGALLSAAALAWISAAVVVATAQRAHWSDPIVLGLIAAGGLCFVAALVLFAGPRQGAEGSEAEVQHLLDSETAARGTSLVPAARLLRTELLDIRHKVEMLKIDSTLSDGFAFPASEWDAQRQLISRDQALYEVVERAYTTAHRVNEIWRWRRTQSTARLIGANLEEDGLDGVDKAALDAIQALERVIEPDKPLHERYSVQEAARELEKDATLETLAGLIREGETLYDSRAGYDQWIASHAAWRERLQTELSDADRIRAFDFAELNEGDVAHERDLQPARLRVDRIVGNLRKLHDDYHRGLR
jgi:hypothetical protein